MLIAGDVVQAQLIAGQHAGQVAIFFLVHVGARKGVLRRINGQVTPGLHGQVAGADQRRARHFRILPRHHADRLARNHAAHGHGAFLVNLVLDLARLQPAPTAFAFFALMPRTFGVGHGDDLHILARHQFCRAFVGGHGAARQQQVLTGYQGAVAAGADAAAHVVDGVGFIEAEFFPGRAFLGLAVEAVVLIFGGLEGQVLAGHQVRFIASADVTGEQQQILARIQGQVAAGLEHGGDLADMVLDALDLFRVVRRMLLVGRRGQVDVAHAADADIALGFDLAAHRAHITPGDHMEVAPGFNHRALLGDDLVARTAANGAAVQGLCRDDIHVAHRLGGGVAATLEGTADAVDIAPGLDRQGAGRLDARRVVDKIGALDAVVAGALVRGDAALVEQVGANHQVDLLPGDDPAGTVVEVIAGQQVETVAGFHQPAIAQVAAHIGAQVAGGAQRADVVEVGASHQAQVTAGNQCTVGGQAIAGLGQVQHRHQHLLAGDGGVFQPHDIVGQGRHLFGGEAHAHGQVQLLARADGIVHQVLEHTGVAGLAVDKTLAGAGDHGLLDQALFIEAIAQALLAGIGVVAQLGQHVIGTQELSHVGQLRVGLDQVLVRVGGKLAVGQALHAAAVAEVEQAILTGGQAEARQAQRVDLLLGDVRWQLPVEVHLGGEAGGVGVGLRAAADVGVAAAHHAVIDTGLGLDIHRAARLDHCCVALVRSRQLGGFGIAPLALHAADKAGHRRFQAAQIIGIVGCATHRITLGKLRSGPVVAFRVTGTFRREHTLGEGVVGFETDVGQLVDPRRQAAGRSDATAAVEHIAADQQQVGARGNAGGRTGVGDPQAITLGNQERTVFLAAFAVTAVDVFNALHRADRRAVDPRLAGQDCTDVLDSASGQAQAAVTLDARRAVDDAGGQGPFAVAVDAQVAHGIDIGTEVFQALDPQAHIAATEQQTVLVEQAGGGQGHGATAAQGAEVVHRGAGQGEVGGGGQATGVVEGAAQAQVEAAVAGDHALGGPVLARAFDTVGREQLPGGGLLKGVDIDREVAGLDQAAVGPVGFIQTQIALGHQTAADVIEVDPGDIEHPGAHMQHAAALVLKGAGGQAQVGIGRFQLAAAVIQDTANRQAALAAGAQGAQLPALVAQAGGGNIQGAGAFDQATVVEGTQQAEVDLLTGDLPGVIDAAATEAHALAGEYTAITVVEDTGVDQRIARLGRELAPGVVQAADREVQAGVFAVDQAIVVVLHQAAGVQGQPSVCRQGAAVAVVQAGRQHRQQGLAGEFAALVVEGCNTFDRQRAGAGQLAVAVDQVGQQVEGQCAVAGQAAGAVVQAVAAQGEGAGAVDGAALAVVERAAEGQGLRASAGNHAFIAVIQAVAGHAEGVVADHHAALVIDLCNVGLQRAIADDFALAVVQRSGGQLGAAAGQQAAFVAVIHSAGGDVQGLSGADDAALVIQGLAGLGGGGTAGNHTTVVADIAGVEADVAGGGAGVIGIYAGFDHAVVGQLAAAAQAHRVAGCEAFLGVQVAAGFHRQGGAGVGRALGVEARRLDVDRATGRGLRHAQVPVGIELDIARAGRQSTVQFHPDTGLGAHQLDRAGIHAAQGRGVNRKLRLGAAIVGTRGGF